MILVPIILFFTLSSSVLASDGDRSPFYQKCLKGCIKSNCTEDGTSFNPRAAQLQDVWTFVLLWSCRDECQYHCLWKTVDAFNDRGFKTPRFHGKWPFVRYMGVQEPASTFSSVLNLLTHAYMHSKIRKQFTVRDTPAVLLWHIFAGVCMHAWVWSSIFHARDKPFTEFMDYACALSMVTALFVAAVVRVFHRRRVLTSLVLLTTVLFYGEHVRYLYTGRIDYEYNILVNIVIGTMGSIIWLWWSTVVYMSGERYTWRMISFTLLTGLALLLELYDAPPLLGTWDAHALWHLSTAPLPILFYRFVIDDLKHIQAQRWTTEKAIEKHA